MAPQCTLSTAGTSDEEQPREESRGRALLRPSGVCVDDAGNLLVTSGFDEVAASCARSSPALSSTGSHGGLPGAQAVLTPVAVELYSRPAGRAVWYAASVRPEWFDGQDRHAMRHLLGLCATHDTQGNHLRMGGRAAAERASGRSVHAQVLRFGGPFSGQPGQFMGVAARTARRPFDVVFHQGRLIVSTHVGKARRVGGHPASAGTSCPPAGLRRLAPHRAWSSAGRICCTRHVRECHVRALFAEASGLAALTRGARLQRAGACGIDPCITVYDAASGAELQRLQPQLDMFDEPNMMAV
jgi:hypothetical protein